MTKAEPLTPKLNILVKSKTDAKPISKIIKFLFLLFYFVFALDFGYIQTKTPAMKKLVKIISLTQSSLLVFFLCYCFLFTHSKPVTLWYALDVAQYYFFSLLLLISKYSYNEFEMDLHSLDAEMHIDSDFYKMQYTLTIVFVTLFTFKVALTVFTCTEYDECLDFPLYIVIGYCLAVIGSNIVFIVYSFLFYSVCSRIKKFTLFVRNESADVVSCHYLYKSIVEITERAKKTFDLILILALVYSTVDITLSIYLPFTEESVQTELQLKGVITYVMVIHELIVLFAPAFTAGMLSSQVDTLKLALYDLLVKDQKHTADVKRFIKYIEARGMRFRVWAVVPLDWPLPVIVANVAVTYLIVMIQFTQK